MGCRQALTKTRLGYRDESSGVDRTEFVESHAVTVGMWAVMQGCPVVCDGSGALWATALTTLSAPYFL